MHNILNNVPTPEEAHPLPLPFPDNFNPDSHILISPSNSVKHSIALYSRTAPGTKLDLISIRYTFNKYV